MMRTVEEIEALKKRGVELLDLQQISALNAEQTAELEDIEIALEEDREGIGFSMEAYPDFFEKKAKSSR